MAASPSTAESITVDLAALRQLIREANDIGSQTVGYAGARIKLCVDAGAKLEAIREAMPHGKWMTWFEENIQDITPRTAQKWMKLSDAVKEGLDLNDARSIRHAYQLSGILPDPEGSGDGKRKAATYLAHADRLIHALTLIDVPALDDAQRSQIAARLKPIVEFHERIAQ